MTSSSGQFDPSAAAPFMLRHGHPGWLGMAYHAHGPDWVELKLPWREDLIGQPGMPVLASGPIISLMDMASGLSIWTTLGALRPYATLDLRVDYQRPARERAAVIGHAQCYKTTRSAAFVRGVAHDGDPDDPVAQIAGVFMSIERDPRSG